jgi:hypothetical protein
MIWFVLGLFVGAAIGAAAMALVVAARTRQRD